MRQKSTMQDKKFLLVSKNIYWKNVFEHSIPIKPFSNTRYEGCGFDSKHATVSSQGAYTQSHSLLIEYNQSLQPQLIFIIFDIDRAWRQNPNKIQF